MLRTNSPMMDKCWLMYFWFPAFLPELYDNMLEWHFWTKNGSDSELDATKSAFSDNLNQNIRSKKRFEHLVIKFWANNTELVHTCDMPHVQKPRTQTRTWRNFGHTCPLIFDAALHTLAVTVAIILLLLSFQIVRFLLMDSWSTAG